MNTKNADFAESFSILLENSEFLHKLKNYGFLFNNSGNLRPLTSDEIKQLEAQCNFCANWNLILSNNDFDPSFIRGNTFIGRCTLGRFDGTDILVDENIKHPNGIYNSTIIESRIESGALVANTACLANALINSAACLYSVGNISASKQCLFGNGTEIRVGNELGGRTINILADMDFELAAHIIMNRDDTSFLKVCEDLSLEYAKRAQQNFCVVESSAIIRHTSTIKNSFIGQSAIIDGAELIEESTVLSSQEEPVFVSAGSIVRKSCLQWGSKVTDISIVEKSLLSGHSTITRHAKTICCIIGANTEIAEGEATSSLVGPFTGYHHQSLLIAALWPLGRGNVAYGANVGSNHTGKAPDQELICGEGLFFGLGTSIKFPANYAASPYSIIATGVCTQAQRVEFPFSLINSPSHADKNIPLSYNEISPGWMLANNIYAILRNEKKFAARSYSNDPSAFTGILRAEIIDMMLKARDTLSAAPIKDFYTDKDINMLGQNYMTRRSLESGIESYNFYIRYYIGSALWNKLRPRPDNTAQQADIFFAGNNKINEHALALADKEFAEKNVQQQLQDFASKNQTIAEKILRSKTRDDQKGRLIIDDYEYVNVTADNDPLIIETAKKAEEIQKAVNEFLKSGLFF